ncbi:MAG: hypothetical protein C0P77_004105 [Thermoanaerobacterales bacterium]|jgi:hypothetical protein|nr:antitoxin [Thermoanaerobacterales bacterium]
MRTTVTLDPDTAALVRRRMKEEGVSFKQALNDAIRAGFEDARRREPFRTATAAMGVPTVDLDRALQLAGEIEDVELVRKMRLGK